jgi:hypothetical protein
MDCRRLKLLMMKRGKRGKRGIGLKGFMMMYRGLGLLRIRLLGRARGRRRGGTLGWNELPKLRLPSWYNLADQSKHHLNLLDRNELPSLDPLLVHPPLDHLPIDQFLYDQLLPDLLPADRMPPLVSWPIPPLLGLHVTEDRLENHRRWHPSSLLPLYLMLVYLPLRESSRPTTLSLFSHDDDGPRVLVHVDLFLRKQRLVLQTNRKPLAHTRTTRPTKD